MSDDEIEDQILECREQIAQLEWKLKQLLCQWAINTEEDVISHADLGF